MGNLPHLQNSFYLLRTISFSLASSNFLLFASTNTVANAVVLPVKVLKISLRIYISSTFSLQRFSLTRLVVLIEIFLQKKENRRRKSFYRCQFSDVSRVRAKLAAMAVIFFGKCLEIQSTQMKSCG